MASTKGQATLSGRFPAGTRVQLFKVRDEMALRPHERSRPVATETVDDDGVLKFSGLVVGGRYIAAGRRAGGPIFVRLVARESAEDVAVLAQSPIGPDRVRLASGQWADEVPARQEPPAGHVVPGQHQVPRGTVQRSDTPLGVATPLGVGEQAPYPRQEDVPKGTVQMSDTERGQAAPIIPTVSRQDQVPDGTVQRSATPEGVAAIIPDKDAVEAQREKDSAEAKASRGEPVRAAAEPLSGPGDGERKTVPGDAPVAFPGGPHGGRSYTKGHDAMGQPLAADVAAATGVTPADSPVEPVERKRSGGSSSAAARKGSAAAKKAAPTRKRNAKKAAGSSSSSSKSKRSKKK